MTKFYQLYVCIRLKTTDKPSSNKDFELIFKRNVYLIKKRWLLFCIAFKTYLNLKKGFTF